MSYITNVHNTIVSTLATLFPAHTRIPNAASLSDNQSIFLRKGYGLTYGGSNQVPSEFCNYSREHIFRVTISRELIRTDSQASEIDTLDKEILEDIYTLDHDFYQNDNLGIPTSIRYIGLGGVSGIENLTAGKNNFRYVTADYIFNVTENL